jgi:UDP-N-acetylglucosamine--N-acetylmuramyl-(pentapeptide) pyrophosphoryl-undecaprenol N-acetylglucosamine transferase
LAPFLTLIGFFQSLKIIKRFEPDVVLTAGSFVCVPVALAAHFSKIKLMVHQIDIIPGLANKIMAKYADKITVSFSESFKDYPKEKTVLTGNPYRKEILSGSKQEAMKLFNLEENIPIILALGGGTGSLKLNEIILNALPNLLKKYQIIHLLGKGKYIEGIEKIVSQDLLPRYHSFEFMKQELKHAYAAADLIITRGGMSTATEISVLEKPAIIFPIPNSHQVFNANYFKINNAAIVLNQEEVNGERLSDIIDQLFVQEGELNRLKINMGKLAQKDANERFVEVMKEVVKING